MSYNSNTELQNLVVPWNFLEFREIPRKHGNSAATAKFRGSARNSAARGKLWSLDISLFQLNHTLDISQVCQMILFSINVDADNNPEMNVT